MKIALVGPFPPPYGGMATYFGLLRASLTSRGHSCIAWDVPPTTSQNFTAKVITRFGGFFRAAWGVFSTKPQIVHCITGSQSNLLANALPLLAARLAGSSSLLSVMGGDFPQMVANGNRKYRDLVRRICRLPQKVIVCNPSIQEALILLGVEKEKVVFLSNALPNSPEAEIGSFPPEVKVFRDKHKTLLFSISGWYPLYGILDLIDAIARLGTKTSVGLLLLVKDVGEANFKAKVRDFIAEKNLTEKVLCLENVPSVNPYFSLADIFVRTPRAEGDSMSVREALSSGIPVLASDAGNRPEGCILFRPGDAADLASRLDALIAGGQPRQAPTAWAGEGEGTRNLERLLAVYRDLAQNNRGS